MPVQAEVTPPWEWMADAHAQLLAAERAGDAAAIDAARDQVRFAREACGQLGGLLLLLALDHAGLRVQKKLARVFDGMARSAWERATAAADRATCALERIDLLEQRLSELEQRLERRADRAMGM